MIIKLLDFSDNLKIPREVKIVRLEDSFKKSENNLESPSILPRKKSSKTFRVLFLIVLILWGATSFHLFKFSDWNFKERIQLRKELKNSQDQLISQLKREKENLEWILNEYIKICYYLDQLYPNPENSSLAKLIAKKAFENREIGLSPEVILAVIQTESGGNANAVSYKNAKGLMQLIDETATDRLNEIGLPFSEKFVFDPVFNVKLGINELVRLHNYWMKKGKEKKDEWTYSFHSYFWGIDGTQKLIDEGREKEIINSDYVSKVYGYFAELKGEIKSSTKIRVMADIFR
ncbi:MAG: transglycosylase SLT domain-containing protein [Acidobacteriota bacterium]